MTGLTNSREYTFEVRAMRGSTAGPASAATARPATALRAPGSLRASTTREYGILLSWDAANDSSITHWEYRTRKESESGWDPDWTTIGGNAGTTSRTIEVSTFNERYVIELRAGRGTENGPSSRTTGVQRDRLRLPANLTATWRNGSAILQWDASADDSITRYQYRHYVLAADNDYGHVVWSDVPGSSHRTTTRTVRGLDADEFYGFEVRAMRGTQEGPASSAYYFPPS